MRLGTAAGVSDIINPQADAGTGLRRVAALGNAQERLSAVVTNLTPGTTYYWGVQSVDTAFVGSVFATNFFTTPALPPL